MAFSIKYLALCVFCLGFVFLPGCAPRVIAKTSNSDLSKVAVGESLWLKRTVEKNHYWSNGQIVAFKKTELFLCRDDRSEHPVCRIVTLPVGAEVLTDQKPSGSHDKERRADSSTNEERAILCQDRCPKFIGDSKGLIQDAIMKAQLVDKCIKSCRNSEPFALCLLNMTSNLFDACSQHLQN